jgi:hypothetical protein
MASSHNHQLQLTKFKIQNFHKWKLFPNSEFTKNGNNFPKQFQILKIIFFCVFYTLSWRTNELYELIIIKIESDIEDVIKYARRNGVEYIKTIDQLQKNEGSLCWTHRPH